MVKVISGTPGFGHFENEVCTRIRFDGRRLKRIKIFILEPIEGGVCRMSTFRIKKGQSKPFVVIGIADDPETGQEVEVGQVAAAVTGSDNHTLQVNDKGDGSGTVDAVGAEGASADVNANDGQGHTDTATGTIETSLPIKRIELRILEPSPG